MEPEVITRTEQAPPLDVATVDAVTRLLAQMERTALAQRPIVLHPHPSANLAEGCAMAPQTAPAGASVHVPMPPAAPAVQAPQQPSEHSPWPLVFSVAMAGVLGSAAAAAATGSPIAVIAVFGFASAWCAAAYHLVLARS